MISIKQAGLLEKLSQTYDEESHQVSYAFTMKDQEPIPLKECLGQKITLKFLNEIRCSACGQKTNKSFQGGHCYRCTMILPECDICMVRPERCHHAQGTCRDNNFAEQHCFQPHILYIARSNIIKVGITRKARYMARWMEQGAMEAQVLAELPDRLSVGLAESAIATILADKSNWRRMLKGEVNQDPFDFYKIQARKVMPEALHEYWIDNGLNCRFEYPIETYPEKVKSVKLEKVGEFSGVLTGMKAQYMMFGDEVINIRSHVGYQCEIEI